MKANEAPEKIILSADRETGILYDEWVIRDLTDNIKIEYTRTDAFIEKACDWIKMMWSETDDRFKEDYTGMLIEDFRKYMEGE